MFHILAISGSLRAGSSNTSVINALEALAPADVLVEAYRGVGSLPHYNPDLDRDPPPPAVVHWRAAIRAADAVVICSPEYAHGVPGALKNALDWIVSSGELMEKRVALINASPHSTHARASLGETLRVMMADLVEEASISLWLPRNSMTAAEIAADGGMAETLSKVIGTVLKR